MQKYIALLRGVNVSGKNKIKMNDLTDHLSNAGFTNIQTYIQSGNIIFECSDKNIHIIENVIHTCILDKFGFEVPVIVKSAGSLRKVLETNPFLKDNSLDVNKLHVTFLRNDPKPEDVLKLAEYQATDDKFIVMEDVVYLCCENGYGKTKLTNTFFENKLKVLATTRNWKTVTKLVEMV